MSMYYRNQNVYTTISLTDPCSAKPGAGQRDTALAGVAVGIPGRPGRSKRRRRLHLPHFSPWLPGLRPQAALAMERGGSGHGVLSNEQVQGRAVFCGPSPLPLSHRMGEGGLWWGRNPGRRSFLACPGLVCVTLSGCALAKPASLWVEVPRANWTVHGVRGHPR